MFGTVLNGSVEASMFRKRPSMERFRTVPCKTVAWNGSERFRTVPELIAILGFFAWNGSERFQAQWWKFNGTVLNGSMLLLF